MSPQYDALLGFIRRKTIQFHQQQIRRLVLIASVLVTCAISPAAFSQAIGLEFRQACTEKMSSISKQEYCGLISVPADHFNDTAEKFETPFRWFESPNPDAQTRRPVVEFNGGPGNSNQVQPFSKILKEFNVLSIGFRGIDSGPILTCPQIERAMTDARRIMEDGVIALNAAINSCLDELEAAGYSAAQFSVAQTLHDMNFVQSALEIDQVHLIAGSFGTRLGLIYQEVFPENVARAVFIGANPPGKTIWSPAATDAVLSRISQVCAQPEACDIDPSEMLAAFRLRDTSARHVLGIGFDDERARISSFLMAYDKAMMPFIADAFSNASRGDSTGLLALSLAHDFAVKSSGIYWGHFVLMAASSDYRKDTDYSKILAPSRTSSFGSPLAQLFWSAMPAERLSLIAPEYRNLTLRQHKTLLISGELDISAPFEQIIEGIMPKRPNAVHWIMPNAGHYNLYGGELITAAADFLLGNDVVQPPGHESFSLQPAIGLGAMLKIALVVVVASIASAAYGIIWLRRRKKHRR